jgi:hypothetical protein
MITLNQTAGNDNSIIWLIEIELSTSTLLFCSGINVSSVSLDNGSEMQVYLNKIQKGSLSTYSQSIPASDAGGIGSRSGFMFVLAAFGGYDLNDYYPATSAENVVMKPARLGFIWTGATLTSEITWLFEGEVENYEVHPDGLYFDVTESNFLDYLTLPPFKVQKDFDDKVSYFPYAPKDSLGKAIPIVYGSFNIVSFTFGKHRLTPAVLVNPSQLIYIAACHKFDYTYQDYDTADRAFIYASGFDSYLMLIPSVGATNNNHNGYYVKILPSTRSSSQYVKGQMICWLKMPGEKTDIPNIDALINEETPGDFNLLDTKQIQFLFTGDQTDELGILNTAASDITFQVTYTTSVDTEQRTIELSFYNPVKSGGAGYSGTITDSHSDASSNAVVSYDFGNDTTAKSDAVLPWDLKEILQLGFTIKNISGATGGSTSGDIVIVAAELVLSNINVYNFGIKKTILLAGMTGGRQLF